MKKGEIYQGIVTGMNFPNKGIVSADGIDVTVKNALPGQTVSFRITKKRNGQAEGRLLEVLEKAPCEKEYLRRLEGSKEGKKEGSKEGNIERNNEESKKKNIEEGIEKNKEENETTGDLQQSGICRYAGICGGCLYQGFPYEEQLRIKEGQVLKLLGTYLGGMPQNSNLILYDGIKPSPRQYGYRNKMEFTFGDEVKDGPLSLGLHKRGSFYDILTVSDCMIMDEDYRKILMFTKDYFSERNIPYFHRMNHTGYLRHLLVRKAARTGEILVALVTSTQTEVDLNPWVEGILQLFGQYADENLEEKAGGHQRITSAHEIVDKPQRTAAGQPIDKSGGQRAAAEQAIDASGTQRTVAGQAIDVSGVQMTEKALRGKIRGILHIENDSLADAVKCDRQNILYGTDAITEELLGLKFSISAFSFFQTNSLGAEGLYELVRKYVQGKEAGGIVYDLYSGTGTIAQMLAPAAKKVIGVEIVEDAVEAAKKNAALNGLHNCEFLVGDVLRVLDEITEKPDYIILDPPRDGIHPKALQKIIGYSVENMVYISCKPTSLARDLGPLTEAGYEIRRLGMVDMFPGTGNVETVCLLSNRKPDTKVRIDVDLEDYYRIKDAKKNQN